MKKPAAARSGGRTRIVEVMEFNPNSFDAQFARLHAAFAAHASDDKEHFNTQEDLLREISTHTKETNGRVTKVERKLEGRWKYLLGGGAGVSLCAMVAWELFRFFFTH